jgi:LysR family hydrogen peroxide-inducible transcriptional activator
MELHQLRNVVAVAQYGTFYRAAERCHASQPSLSQQIQRTAVTLGVMPTIATYFLPGVKT